MQREIELALPIFNSILKVFSLLVKVIIFLKNCITIDTVQNSNLHGSKPIRNDEYSDW